MNCITIIKIANFESIMNLPSFTNFSYLIGMIKIILWLIYYLMFAIMYVNEKREAIFIFSKINSFLNHLLNKVLPSCTMINNLN